MINKDNLAIASDSLRAITHPLRLSILAFIDKNEMVNVNQIYNTLKLEQSITSQHLRILRKSNLVITEREGKFVKYSVNYTKISLLKEKIDLYL